MTSLGLGVITPEDELRYDALPPALRNQCKDPVQRRRFELQSICERSKAELARLDGLERAGYASEEQELFANIEHRYHSDRLALADRLLRSLKR